MEPDPNLEPRRLMRRRRSTSLATSLDGGPYVSLALVACDTDASPLLLLSDLAQHSRNLTASDRVSLLFEAASGLADPMTGPRLTALGRASQVDDPRALARFLARHPSAEAYAGFSDFHLWRVTVERGHFIAGFGRIEQIDGEALHSPGAEALAAAEAGVVAHMNADHADALDLYAQRLLGLDGDGWRMTGIDPDGIDLVHGEAEPARLEFEQPVLDARGAREMLVRLVGVARG